MVTTQLVKAGLPPGPLAPAPIQTVRQLRDPYGFLLDCHQRYGDVFTLRIIPCGTMVYVADPDIVRSLFASPYLRGGSVNAYMVPLLGKGLLTLDGEDHTTHRRILAPLFATQRLRAHEAMIADETSREILAWRGQLALRPRFDRLAMCVMRRILFGTTASEIEPLLVQIKERSMVDAAAAVVARRVGLRTRVARLVDDVDRVVRSAIARRRSALAGAGSARDGAAGIDDRVATGIRDRDDAADVLSALLATHLDDDAIRDELLTLLFAGHETVATTLSWVFERVVRHPAVLARLSATPDSDYVDAVIKETMRQRSCLADVGRSLPRRWPSDAGTCRPARRCSRRSFRSTCVPTCIRGQTSFGPSASSRGSRNLGRSCRSVAACGGASAQRWRCSRCA